MACERRDTDRYGRMVAVCRAGTVDIGEQMVAEGWAVAFVRYSAAYVGQEAEARQARRGLWAGRFRMPREWRASHRR